MTLEEQIKNRCVHFNGIHNGVCKAGICYRDVAGDIKTLPCLNKGNNCEYVRFPTEEEFKETLKEIQQLISNDIDKPLL